MDTVVVMESHARELFAYPQSRLLSGVLTKSSLRISTGTTNYGKTELSTIMASLQARIRLEKAETSQSQPKQGSICTITCQMVLANKARSSGEQRVRFDLATPWAFRSLRTGRDSLQRWTGTVPLCALLQPTLSSTLLCGHRPYSGVCGD